MNLFDLLDQLDSKDTKGPNENLTPLPIEPSYRMLSETSFHPEEVAWKEASFMPGLKLGEVIGIIPQNIIGPGEGRKCSIQSPEWKEMQNQWQAYVWSVGGALPEKQRYSTQWNHWIELMEKARDNQEPIKLRVNFTNCIHFRNLKVCEYLPSTEGSVSND